jgi:hypothetical protein
MHPFGMLHKCAVGATGIVRQTGGGKTGSGRRRSPEDLVLSGRVIPG